MGFVSIVLKILFLTGALAAVLTRNLAISDVKGIENGIVYFRRTELVKAKVCGLKRDGCGHYSVICNPEDRQQQITFEIPEKERDACLTRMSENDWIFLEKTDAQNSDLYRFDPKNTFNHCISVQNVPGSFQNCLSWEQSETMNRNIQKKWKYGFVTFFFAILTMKHTILTIILSTLSIYFLTQNRPFAKWTNTPAFAIIEVPKEQLSDVLSTDGTPVNYTSWSQEKKNLYRIEKSLNTADSNMNVPAKNQDDDEDWSVIISQAEPNEPDKTESCENPMEFVACVEDPLSPAQEETDRPIIKDPLEKAGKKRAKQGNFRHNNSKNKSE